MLTVKAVHTKQADRRCGHGRAGLATRLPDGRRIRHRDGRVEEGEGGGGSTLLTYGRFGEVGGGGGGGEAGEAGTDGNFVFNFLHAT